MGEQRLLQVRNSTLTPSLVGSSRFDTLPMRRKVAQNEKEGPPEFIPYLNLGLGEYGIGDEVVWPPP